MKKPISMIDLPPFVCDDLHFDGRELEGYNKPFNFVVCEREAGKSVFLWKKIYNAFRKYGFPSLVLKRLSVDITEQYIEDTITLLEKFTGTRLPLEYTKQDIKQGMMDVRLNGKVFFRVIALSAPMSRLKSMVLRNVAYMVMDEFICNMRIGEKYLTEEPMRVKEVFTTYNRESEKGIKVFFMGNPYSLYNPYFSWKQVPTRKLFPGAIVAGQDYVVHCYQIKPELKAKILEHNPLYQFDESYKKYAFDGLAVQDANINLVPEQPHGFKLYYIFKLNDILLAVYYGVNEDITFWARRIDEKEISKRRDVYCFDFGQMSDQTILMANEYKKGFQHLKESVRKRLVGYQSIEASWMLEEIYQYI